MLALDMSVDILAREVTGETIQRMYQRYVEVVKLIDEMTVATQMQVQAYHCAMQRADGMETMLRLVGVPARLTEWHYILEASDGVT